MTENEAEDPIRRLSGERLEELLQLAKERQDARTWGEVMCEVERRQEDRK